MKIVLIMLMLVGCVFGLDNGIYKVINVVDGDTVDIALPDDKKARVRLAFIDTMESSKNKRAKDLSVKCNIDITDIVEDGKESKKYLMEMILTKDVNIKFYGMDNKDLRYIGEIFLPNDPESVNIKMIKYGNALPYITYIKKYKQDVNFYKNIVRENEDYITTDVCVKSSLGK